MSIEPGLYAHLSAAAGVSALVGTRIYPDRLPEAAALPAITYQRVSTVAQQGIGGLAELASARVQITAWADGPGRYSAAKEIAGAVVQSLAGFRGDWGSVPVSGINYDGSYDIDGDPEAELAGVGVDMIIWHRGAVP